MKSNQPTVSCPTHFFISNHANYGKIIPFPSAFSQLLLVDRIGVARITFSWERWLSSKTLAKWGGGGSNLDFHQTSKTELFVKILWAVGYYRPFPHPHFQGKLFKWPNILKLSLIWFRQLNPKKNVISIQQSLSEWISRI